MTHNVRDAPRVLALNNGSESANLADIDVITLPSGNSSSSTITSVSNGVVGKVYVFYNTGGVDGLRYLNFNRSQWYLPQPVDGASPADIALNIYDTWLAYCNTSTTIVGAAPAANNG